MKSAILSSALSIEKNDDHPVAVSIADFISGKGIKPTTVTNFAHTPGSGSAGRVNLGIVSPVVLVGSPAAVAHSTIPFHADITEAITQAHNEGLTASVLSWDGVALAVFVVGDQIKPDAKKDNCSA
ncbi:MAG: hypothetical protein WDO06_00360 [Actinomycetota bacterium]